MLVAVIEAPGRIGFEELPTPAPGAGQVLLRLEGCGVCASSLPLFEGREWFEYPRAPGSPGHEGWGVIEALGPDVTGLVVGQRVAAISERAFATHDLVEARAVLPLSPALAGRDVPGEPLACAVNVARRADVQPGQTVAVVGIGFMGALAVRLASRAGARVLALSRRESSLRLAQAMGADQAIVMDDHQRVVREVMQATGGRGCDVTIEAGGAQWPLDLAGEVTRVRGRLVIAGYHQDPRQVNLQLWNWRGLDVINAHERELERYTDGLRRGLALLTAGELDLAPLLTHALPLEELGAALELTRHRPDGFVKAVVRCG